jgi:hypothetical protein
VTYHPHQYDDEITTSDRVVAVISWFALIAGMCLLLIGLPRKDPSFKQCLDECRESRRCIRVCTDVYEDED